MRHFNGPTLAPGPPRPEYQTARGDGARAVGATYITTPEYSDGGTQAAQAVRQPHAEAARAQGGAARIAGSGVLVRAARTAEQLESFRRVWAGLVEDELQTDPDYFLWSLGGEAQVLRPHVLAVDRDGRTDAILVARLSEIRMPSKLGYATVYAPTVRALSVVHDGLLGQRDCGIAEAVLDELFAGLELGVADVVLFRQLRRESPLRQAVQERASFLSRQRIARTEHRWQIDLPNTFEDYLASLSSTTRKGIRRTAAQVEKAFGDRLSIRRFQDVADLEVYLRDAESVAARTYQRSLGVGFLDDERQRARVRMLMEHGWFRSYVLYLDGQPAAFEQGEAYGSRFVSVRAGYDPAHGQHRIGAYLLVKAIEDLVRDARFSIFDFGLGDAEYKRKLAHRSIEEGDLAVFARRARPIRINIARTGLQGVSSGVTASLRKVALLDASKQRWRRHATRRSRRR